MAEAPAASEASAALDAPATGEGAGRPPGDGIAVEAAAAPASAPASVGGAVSGGGDGTTVGVVLASKGGGG